MPNAPGNVALKSPKTSLNKAHFGNLRATVPGVLEMFGTKLEGVLLLRVEVATGALQ